MQRDLQTQHWNPICTLERIVPDTGVCALINGRQVAVFRVGADESAPRLFAIDNVDPNSDAAVLSRGLVGSIGERIVVASPIYKQHFDLQTGECLEAPHNSVSSYPVRVEDGRVWVGA
ncbi:nitrite reductase small subunit NirD [Massilia forsythiae]|uniref:Nitrite reductase small subunit NirD n=1 Tax=Massilia forsythiae TaxID=2728020 RepID=A0A7Z2ZSM8_9BURK|nr:nitrite reductase small subunit NirD [Massilia forsythiae]QJD99126.1 nitrite reductase small subunit NirD [Massilia forsythiae]